MNHSAQRTQREILQYMVTVTQKLSRTCRDLSEIGRDLLKSLTHNHRSERYRNRYRDKDYRDYEAKDKEKDDLDSNLIGEEGFQMEDLVIGINGRKKLKIKNRIQQAQEQQEPLLQQPQVKFSPVRSNVASINKKQEEKPDKQKPQQPQPQQQKPEDNKKKAKQISHKPKAPTSSFLLFFKQQQQSIAKSYPNYGVVQLTKVAAKCWNELSVEEKDPYQKLFEVERKKYQQEMEKYKKMFPEEVRRKQLQKKQKKKKRAKQRRQRQGKQPKQVKQPKLPKQKPIPIVANNENNPYNQLTPGGVKIEDVAQEREQDLQEDFLDVKNQQEMPSDELGSLEGDSEENSLGQDI